MSSLNRKAGLILHPGNQTVVHLLARTALKHLKKQNEMVGGSRVDPQASKRCARALQRHPLVHGCDIALLQGGVSVTERQGKAPRKQVVDGTAQCMVEGEE